MSSASNYLELKILDHVLRNDAYTQPTGLWVALFTGDPGEAGSYADEVSGTGTAYSRQAIAFNAAASGASANTSTVTFPTATANWGTIAHIAIVDSATTGAGEVLFYGPVSTAKVIETDDTFQITAGNLTISLD